MAVFVELCIEFENVSLDHFCGQSSVSRNFEISIRVHIANADETYPDVNLQFSWVTVPISGCGLPLHEDRELLHMTILKKESHMTRIMMRFD
jgi:hypothetical protein